MTIHIEGLSAESIQNTNDVRTWARNHEIGQKSELDQMKAGIADNKERSKRNSRWLLFSVSLFASVLVIVVVLFGVPLIFRF